MKKFALAFLALFLLFLLPCTTFAESSYNMSEADLTRLLQITQQLQQLNNQLSTDLATSQTDLQESQQKLVAYQQELEQLKTQLATYQTESVALKEQLASAQTLLQNSNQSLTEYKKRVSREIVSLKVQRGLLLAAIVLISII